MSRAGACAWLLVALVAAPAMAAAQTCQTANNPPDNCNANLTVVADYTNPRTMLLVLSTTTTTVTTTITDFDNTFAQLTGPTATAYANRAWTLLISASAATWTNTGVGSRAGKPAAELRWSTATNGTYTALTTTPVQVATGSATDGTVASLFFRATLNWTLDTPGQYTLGVVFTATTP